MGRYIILFAVSIIASGSTSYFYKKIGQRTEGKSAALFVNAAWMLAVSLVFFLVAAASGQLAFTYDIVLTALLAGVMLAAAAFMLIESLRRSSYTIAVIIVNMNFYIPILLSWLILKEAATLLQLVGIFIVTVVIIVINLRGRESRKNSGKDSASGALPGIVCACIACVSNGVMNFCIKLQQYNTPGEGRDIFYFFLYLFAALTCLVAALIIPTGKNQKGVLFAGFKSALIPALMLGVCVTASFYPQSILSGSQEINAAAQFTITITGSLILALVIGWTRYKEKITARGIISLVLCLVAVIFQLIN